MTEFKRKLCFYNALNHDRLHAPNPRHTALEVLDLPNVQHFLIATVKQALTTNVLVLVTSQTCTIATHFMNVTTTRTWRNLFHISSDAVLVIHSVPTVNSITSVQIQESVLYQSVHLQSQLNGFQWTTPIMEI